MLVAIPTKMLITTNAKILFLEMISLKSPTETASTVLAKKDLSSASCSSTLASASSLVVNCPLIAVVSSGLTNLNE